MTNKFRFLAVNIAFQIFSIFFACGVAGLGSFLGVTIALGMPAVFLKYCLLLISGAMVLAGVGGAIMLGLQLLQDMRYVRQNGLPND